MRRRADSVAQIFESGRSTPVVGRFAIPGGNPYAPDSSVPIRSMALRFALADGEQWRTGMNSMPVFPVSTPQAFYEMLQAQQPDPATGKPDPQKLAAFFAAHPETAAFRAWAKMAKPSASFAVDSYDSLDAFIFVGPDGRRHAIRWRMVPETAPATLGTEPPPSPNYLDADLGARLSQGPLRWHLFVTFAEPGDPIDDAARGLPALLPSIQKPVAHASHWLLYALMVLHPLVGWAMLSAGGYPVMLAESLRLPPIFPVSAAAFAVLRHLHTWLAMLLFATFLAHMAAALYHGLIRRDGVLSSMTTRRLVIHGGLTEIARHGEAGERL